MGNESRILLPNYAARGDVVRAAQWCLGKRLVIQEGKKRVSGIIVETEAYGGEIDKACHAYNNRSVRNEAMFGPPGTVYVYLIYGMYYCINLVVGAEDVPKAVLVRALEPDEGIEVMQKRRAKTKLEDLCSGPGKLCQALGIDSPSHNFEHVQRSKKVWLEPARRTREVLASPRIGISQSVDLPWRFFEADSPHVSKVPKSIREKVRKLA